MRDLPKRWQLYPFESELTHKIGRSLNRHPVIAQILLNRRIRSLTHAREFLSPQPSSEEQFDLDIMDRACRILEECRSRGTRILIYGDYDVDGMTSTAMMKLALESAGLTADYYVPNRFVDGYGLSKSIVGKVRDGRYGLLITLDCGISNHAEIRAVKNQTGAQVIILDHHSIPAVIPDADVIINPKTLLPEHPFYHLCTAGIVYKFLEYYSQTSCPDVEYTSFLDLAALGTIADVAPLTGENRVITRHGLDALSSRKRPGIRAILEVAGFTRDRISTRDTGFTIAPRLNAAGRLGNPRLGVELLVAQTEEQARHLAETLQRMNTERQMIGQRMLTEATDYLDATAAELDQRVIVLSSTDWHAGIIGITAAQLVEKYARPVVLASLDQTIGRGSARSCGNVNIYQLLKECQQFFTTFGGHKEAAGFSIAPEKMPEFKAAFQQVAKEAVAAEDLHAVLDIDCPLHAADMTLDLAREVAELAPFGQGNPVPLFYTDSLKVIECRPVGDGSHLKATFTDRNGNRVIDGIGFGLAHKLELFYKESPELVFSLEQNEWNGRVSPQLQLVDIK